jgi:hypothetical protein
MLDTKPCRRWLASEGGVEVVEFKTVIAGKPAPTGMRPSDNHACENLTHRFTIETPDQE